MSQRNYLFSIIAYGAAPVILSHKPACLLSFNNSFRNLATVWNKHKSVIKTTLELEYFELKKDQGSVYVLFYNRPRLESHIQITENREYLYNSGYSSCTKLSDYLNNLRCKFKNECPHEIGLFLGFPLEDVEGFIANKGKNYSRSGYWKVYSDSQRAISTFNAYNIARATMMEIIMNMHSTTQEG